jgi:hypothetical protein
MVLIDLFMSCYPLSLSVVHALDPAIIKLGNLLNCDVGLLVFVVERHLLVGLFNLLNNFIFNIHSVRVRN